MTQLTRKVYVTKIGHKLKIVICAKKLVKNVKLAFLCSL